jgi:hypothetical protein
MPPRGRVDLVLVVFLGQFVAHGCLLLRGSVKRQGGRGEAEAAEGGKGKDGETLLLPLPALWV